MRNPLGSRQALVTLVALGALAGCGGAQQAAPPPPPPPPPAAPPPPPPATASSVPPATAAPTAEQPPAPPPHHAHSHTMVDMFVMTLDSLDLKPEQKTAVAGIETDLEKVGDAMKEPRHKLVSDVADGVAAGKLDKAKTDADVKAIGTAVTGTIPTVQDAMNRLYKTLDAEQRKKLASTVREREKAMHEHMMGPGGEHEHGMGPGGEHGMGPGHGMGGPGMGPGGEHGMGPGHGPGGPGSGAPGAPGGPGPAASAGPGGPGAMGPGGPGPKGPGGMGPGDHEHGMGPGHMGPGGMGPGGMGPGEHGMGPGMHGGAVEMLGQELALTDDQKQKLRTKLEALQKSHEGEMKSKMEAGQKHVNAVLDAFAGDKFDAKKAGVGTQGPDMVKAMAKAKVEFVQTVLGVLTPEQRPKFAEHIRAHADDPDAPSPSGG